MDARYKKLDMDLYMDLQGKFDEKLIIGESVDFSQDFRIYIGRKWFGLGFVIGLCGG